MHAGFYVRLLFRCFVVGRQVVAFVFFLLFRHEVLLIRNRVSFVPVLIHKHHARWGVDRYDDVWEVVTIEIRNAKDAGQTKEGIAGIVGVVVSVGGDRHTVPEAADLNQPE